MMNKAAGAAAGAAISKATGGKVNSRMASGIGAFLMSGVGSKMLQGVMKKFGAGGVGGLATSLGTDPDELLGKIGQMDESQQDKVADILTKVNSPEHPETAEDGAKMFQDAFGSIPGMSGMGGGSAMGGLGGLTGLMGILQGMGKTPQQAQEVADKIHAENPEAEAKLVEMADDVANPETATALKDVEGKVKEVLHECDCE